MNIKKIRTICIVLATIGINHSCITSKYKSLDKMVARVQLKEPVEGVCKNSNIIAILPLPNNGQVEAKAPKTDSEIAQELNEKVSFLKDKPTYEDKGMVSLIINCKGELVKYEMDNKTKNVELDKQILAVFSELKNWTPGKVKNNSVDTIVLINFTIKNGEIILN